jgi:hypothetical protein
MSDIRSRRSQSVQVFLFALKNVVTVFDGGGLRTKIN